MKKSYRLYNIILPIWLLIWFPSWLWLILLGAMYLLGAIGGNFHEIEFGLNWNPFSNIFSMLIILAAILVSGICIYHLDKRILQKETLTAEQVKKTALALAVVTAPYLYLLPASLFYR